jgi:phage repressor protein C with HTH and peptisase S24 domain
MRHAEVWRAIDRLAAKHGFSASGLAKRAGLDATSFNKSKRKTREGKPHWPSTESVARVLTATSETMAGFVALMGGTTGALARRQVPMLSFADAGQAKHFDEHGTSVGTNWDETSLSPLDDSAIYALKVSGNALAPAYRSGDFLLVSSTAPVRRGDRVLLKLRRGDLMVLDLVRRGTRKTEFAGIGVGARDRSLAGDEIRWMARIVGAIQ